MKGKILVAYAGRCGSTAEVAQAIGRTLGGAGNRVDVLDISSSIDLKGYDAAVIGSAVRIGQLMPETLKFVKENREILNGMPVALFSVGITPYPDTTANRARAFSFLSPLLSLVNPLSAACFAGKVDTSNLPLPQKLIVKAVKCPQGDFRDWDVIREWARGLVAT